MISIKNQPMWRRALIVSAIAVAGISLTGCSMINGLLPGGNGGDTPASSAAEGDSTAGGDSTAEGEGTEGSVFDLKVGDCLGDAEGDTVSDVTIIDCSLPHTYEVFYDFELTGDEFPGDDVITTQAQDGCMAEFEPFVGMAYDSSALDFTYFSPIQQGWDELGDKLVSCLIADPAGPTTGTLAGAAR